MKFDDMVHVLRRRLGLIDWLVFECITGGDGEMVRIDVDFEPEEERPNSKLPPREVKKVLCLWPAHYWKYPSARTVVEPYRKPSGEWYLFLAIALISPIVFALLIFRSEQKMPAPESTRFVGSRTSRPGMYHSQSCRHAKRIRKKNRVEFRTPEEAKEKGYEPCTDCTPDGGREGGGSRS